MRLPIFQTKLQELSLMQTAWAAKLNMLLNAAQNNSIILANVALTTGDNTINHLLGQKLQGWKIVRQRATASIYDKQDSNMQPELTLVLNTSADVTVDIEVF